MVDLQGVEKNKDVSKLTQSSLLVVGGGVTGMVSAYIAAKSGQKVAILEGNSEFGGLLSTFEVGGASLEKYYHHFFTHDQELQWLLKELQLSHALEFRKTTMGIYTDGKVYPFDTPKDLLQFSPLRFLDKIRFGLTSLYLGKAAQWRNLESISVMKWMHYWAGKRVVKFIWEPLLKVKFGKYSSNVPVAWLVGRLGQRFRSRKKGTEELGYLKGSLKTLLLALESKLKEMDVEMTVNTKVDELIVEKGRVLGVKSGAYSFMADKVILTIPSPIISRLIAPYDASLAERVAKVNYFGAVCTVLELDRALGEIYWMNIADNGFPFGGIIEHTNFIPPSEYGGNHIVYLSKYFTLDEPIASMSENEIADQMIAPLVKIYPDFKINQIKKQHVFKTNSAATICELNFSASVVESQLSIAGLFICNMQHIYPDERSVNNSIRIASEACKVMGIPSAYLAPSGNSLSGQIGFE